MSIIWDQDKMMNDFYEFRDKISKYSTQKLGIFDEMIDRHDTLIEVTKDLLKALDEKETQIKKIKSALKSFMLEFTI
jgi:enoyl-CoA hydratase/carnithine racemase